MYADTTQRLWQLSRVVLVLRLHHTYYGWLMEAQTAAGDGRRAPTTFASGAELPQAGPPAQAAPPVRRARPPGALGASAGAPEALFLSDRKRVGKGLRL